MSNLAVANVQNLAKTLDISGEPDQLVTALKQTAFKGSDVSDAQMGALLIVANQYGLNPWLKEIYAFPDKGGIVPVVGVDGWSRIINTQPQFDGMDFEQDDQSCTCVIYRKDRAHPIKVTEWMSECSRNTGPWKSHPKRMLRHKAMIQCSRIAFGFAGIFDPDEADRIVEKDVTPVEQAKAVELDFYPEDDFAVNIPAWRDLIECGRKTADDIIAVVKTKYQLTQEQCEAIHACTPIEVEQETAA